MHRPNRTAPFGRRVAIPALLLAIALAGGAHAQQALGPAFTYQGELRQAGVPAQGSFDLRFRLFDAADGGTAIGATIVRSGVTVEDGLFSVALDFGPAQFAGERQWLAVEVRPAGGSTFEPLLPRTEVTAAPYAWSAATALANSVTTTSIIDGTIKAIDIDGAEVQRRVSGTCPSGQAVRSVAADGSVTCGAIGDGTVTSVASGAGLTGGPIIDSGTIAIAPGGVTSALIADGTIASADINADQVQRRVSGSCPAGQYIQSVATDGSVVCGVDAPAGGGWSLSGNAGINPATQFIGTTDAQPLELRAGNARGLRIEPSSVLASGVPITASVNAGSHANVVEPGVLGAVIAGGGASASVDPVFPGARPNRVTDNFGVVGGGFGNIAGDGDPSLQSAAYATVGGGVRNVASGSGSVVAGGFLNEAAGVTGAVLGGDSNLANGSRAAVVAGFLNGAVGNDSIVAAGTSNVAAGSSSAVLAGVSNSASGDSAAVGSGRGNCAGGSFSWVGGLGAQVRPGPSGSLARGVCDDVPPTVSGGDAGTFVWADSQPSTFTSTGRDQFLLRANGGVGINSTAIPAGIELLLSSRSSSNANVDILLRSASNTRGINLAMLPGSGVQAAEFRVAQFDGSVFTDRLLLRANGDLEVTANAFKPGGGSWAVSSDARLKHQVAPLSGTLDRLLSLQGVSFEYLAPDPAKRPTGTQVGFVAQDVQQVFPDWVSTDNDGYLLVAPRGFEALTVEALRELRGESAAIDGGQDLRIAALEASNARLAAENAALRDNGEALRRRVERLEAWIAGGGPESR